MFRYQTSEGLSIPRTTFSQTEHRESETGGRSLKRGRTVTVTRRSSTFQSKPTEPTLFSPPTAGCVGSGSRRAPVTRRPTGRTRRVRNYRGNPWRDSSTPRRDGHPTAAVGDCTANEPVQRWAVGSTSERQHQTANHRGGARQYRVTVPLQARPTGGDSGTERL